MTNKRLLALLAYAGTLPFMACALLLAVGVPQIPDVAGVATIAAAYGVAIASFMAGVHWGTYLYNPSKSQTNLLATSNIITLAVWFAFALAPTSTSLAVTGLAFGALLAVDYQLAAAGLIAREYLTVRRNVTGIVIATLILTILLS